MRPGQIGLSAGRGQSGFRVRVNVLSAIVLAAVLAGCAFDPPTIQRTPREAAGAENNAKSRLAARKGTPGSTASAPGAAGAGEFGVPGDEVAALEVDLTNFKERLVGLDSDEINDLLGTPGLERAEPPALIWQYRHTNCTVDVFMFDDGGGAIVDHVEVRAGQGPAADEKACFTSLLRNTKSAALPRGKQPVSPSPSVPVGRGTAATPSRSGPASAAPAPRPTAPGASPASPAPDSPPSSAPARAAPSPAAPGDMDDASPEDTDVDFDFGPQSNAPPGAVPETKSDAAPMAPIMSAVPPPPSLTRPPAPAAAPSVARTAPAPTSAMPPLSDVAPSKAVDLNIDMDSPAPVPVAPSPTAERPAPAAAMPASLPPAASAASSPRTAIPLVPSTATAAAAPKGAKGAPRPIESVDDEDLPPDLLRGRRPDDDPANTNEDMVE